MITFEQAGPYVVMKDEAALGFVNFSVLDKEDLARLILAFYPSDVVREQPEVAVVVSGIMHMVQEAGK